jgi:uncharacterized iron-regulated membrane protein
MKRWWLRLHRWSGLLIAAVVLVIGGTGAVIAYQAEVDGWLNADLLRVEPAAGARPIPLDPLVAAAESTRSGMRASGVRLPQSPDESVEISVEPHGAPDFSGHYVYVDRVRGEVLGSRPFDPDPWSRRGLVASLYEAHYSLAASRAGVWLVSAVAAAWLVVTGLGLVLALPRSGQEWRRVLRMRPRATPTQFNLGLHRLIGLLIAPVLAVVLVTGIALNLAPQAAGLLQRLSPLTFEPALPARAAPASADPIGWQTALDVATAAQPAATPYSLYLDPQRGVYVVRLRETAAIHRRGQVRVYVDARDATVLAIWNPRSGSGGDRVWAWQNPLHSGHAFGAPGRLLVFLAGLAAVLCVLTGVPLWLARRSARKR